jgi:predicted ATP-dependent serine protease
MSLLTKKYRCWHCGEHKEVATGLCLKCHKFPNIVHSKYISLALELDELQSTKNEGRGISCVRTIITFLNRAQLDLAKNVYEVDGDKICNVYPDIDKMICEGLNINPRYTSHGW